MPLPQQRFRTDGEGRVDQVFALALEVLGLALVFAVLGTQVFERPGGWAARWPQPSDTALLAAYASALALPGGMALWRAVGPYGRVSAPLVAIPVLPGLSVLLGDWPLAPAFVLVAVLGAVTTAIFLLAGRSALRTALVVTPAVWVGLAYAV